MSEQTELQPQPQALPKPPTLASLIIDNMKRIIGAMLDIESTQHLLLTYITRGNAVSKLLAIVSIGIATLSVLLNIATLVLVAYLIGHVR